MVFTCCLTTAGELSERPISYTVEQIRKACEQVDEEYVRSRMDYIDIHRPPLSTVSTLVISSWARLAYGCSDFGLGDPTQFGCGALASELCVFQPEGEKGIAVVMTLPESAMSTFQNLIEQVWVMHCLDFDQAEIPNESRMTGMRGRRFQVRSGGVCSFFSFRIYFNFCNYLIDNNGRKLGQ